MGYPGGAIIGYPGGGAIIIGCPGIGYPGAIIIGYPGGGAIIIGCPGIGCPGAIIIGGGCTIPGYCIMGGGMPGYPYIGCMTGYPCTAAIYTCYFSSAIVNSYIKCF